MTLADFSIKRPVFAWMLMAACVIFGAISYTRLGVSQLPDVDFPVVNVRVAWENAAPEVMETDIIDVLEDALMGIQGVRSISSKMNQGRGNITVELELGIDVDVAVQEVQTKIMKAQRVLPKDMDPPIVSKSNPEDQPIMWLTATGGTNILQLMSYVQDHLKDQFSTIEGVGEVFLGGFTERNLRVWLDLNKMNFYQITAEDVIYAITSQHQELPAGSIEAGKSEIDVRVLGEALTPDEFGNIIIEKRGGSPIFARTIRLKDISTIENGLAEIRLISRSDGKLAVGLGIRKQRGSNQVEVSHKILKKMENAKKYLPPGFDLSVRFNQSTFIENSVNELIFTLLLSALATSLVCWLFLGSWSATINILLAIPTSILGTFVVIYFFGFTLNTFTVLGLSLSVGIVVDDAIMMLENIMRYREKGMEKVAAARKGARQITFAALASTIALIAIFLPVAFMTGIIGRYFFQYGITISVAVALSLLEALTLTPMRCSQFLQVGKRSTAFGQGVDKSFKFLAEAYKNGLKRALKYRKFVIISAFLFFAASLLIILVLNKELVPSQDMSSFVIRAQTPPGSSLQLMDAKMKLIEQYAASRPEVESFYSMVGGFSGDVNQGNLFVTLKRPGKRPIVKPFKKRPTQAELMSFFRKEISSKIKGVRVNMQDPSQSGFTARRGYPVEFTVQGPDWDKLTEFSAIFQEEMKKSGLMTDIDSDYKGKVSQLHIIPDRKKAAERGVDINSISRAINTLIGGQPISKYSEGGKRYDVRIRLLASQRTKPSDIQKIYIWNNRGQLVNLNDVVTLKQEEETTTLTRQNRERAISVSANITEGKSQSDAFAEISKIAKRILPLNYSAVFTGSSQTFMESISSLVIVLLMGILISYMVLASQFNSYIHPLTILISLPFSISGALLALLAGNQSINIYSFIGVILLMGIVKKNAILLVDFTNQYRAQKLKVHDALIKACPVRLRPILMTSLATIAGALPPALALGPGAETRIPMAIAVIGGVIFSTIFTLFVVPCVYSYFSKIERFKYNLAYKEEV